MTDPAIRPRWQAGVTGVDELPTAPRRGVGTTNHCMHGKDVLIEEILDWRPTDYVTQRSTMSNGFQAVSSFVFEDVPDGTPRPDPVHLGQEPARNAKRPPAVHEFLADVIGRGQANLRAVLVEEMDRRAALAAEAPPEPDAPGSLDRELREPVRR